MGMKQNNIAFSIVLMVLAGVAILNASQLPFGTLEQPQAGFWPLTLAIMLAFVALIHCFNSFKGEATSGTPFFAPSGGWKKLAMVVGAMIAFGFLLESLGYLISVFLLTGFLLRVIEPIKWRLVIAIALLNSGVTYFLLDHLLGFPLPTGLLGI